MPFKADDDIKFYASLNSRIILATLFSDGQLRSIATDQPFQFEVKEGDKDYNQCHYEALGKVSSLTAVIIFVGITVRPHVFCPEIAELHPHFSISWRSFHLLEILSWALLPRGQDIITFPLRRVRTTTSLTHSHSASFTA